MPLNCIFVPAIQVQGNLLVAISKNRDCRRRGQHSIQVYSSRLPRLSIFYPPLLFTNLRFLSSTQFSPPPQKNFLRTKFYSFFPELSISSVPLYVTKKIHFLSPVSFLYFLHYKIIPSLVTYQKLEKIRTCFSVIMKGSH